jgi:DNA-directed RNA polymerase specialized sigma24 family protein
LLKECQRQNRQAQKSFYHSFANAMVLLCRRYVKTDEEAEEVMMTGFLKFFQSLPRFIYVNEASSPSLKLTYFFW